MNDTFFMSRVERIANLPRDREPFIERYRALCEPLAQRGTIDQLHDQVIRPDVLNRADAGVVQRGDGARFSFEPLTEAIDLNLDRDFTVQAGIQRAVDFAHSTLADLGKDFVGPLTRPSAGFS